MRNKYALLLFISLTITACGQNLSTVSEIKSWHEKWQADIRKNIENSPRIYLYLSGKNRSKAEWTLKENSSDEVFLSSKVVAIKSNGYGFFIRSEQYALSGDFFIVQDDYYDKKGSLIFVSWNMNTFHSFNKDTHKAEPATVSKQIYFNSKGEKLLETLKTYRMNTKEEINIDFLGVDVEINMRISDVEFFHLLKWEPYSMADKNQRKARQILRKAESAVDDPNAERALAREGIHLGGVKHLTGAELRGMLKDERKDSRPWVTITCYLDDTPVTDRGEVEDPLSSYVDEVGIGEWVGSGQGSIGKREFFDVQFAVFDLAKAIPLIKAKLIELGVGPQTEIEASDGSVHRLK